jgi:hypothetical protein
MPLIAKKQRKKGLFLSQVRALSLSFLRVVLFMGFWVVRKYVEGMKESLQLLDLLSDEQQQADGGDNEIEPTRGSGVRKALYPDVRHLSA